MKPHEIPTRPWQKVATDLFTWNGRNFLVTVDYYSRYFEVDELTTTSSASVIKKLSAHFARHGIPETVMSDNGPQYASEEFALFATGWDFIHITSSPHYPQSNGLAERTVHTVKDIFDKAKESETNPLKAILQYRTTPVDHLASPAELLMGRQLRASLPATHQHLSPKTIPPSVVVQRRQEMQEKQKKYYNRGAHPLTSLKAGEQVFIKATKGEDWKPATILGQASDRSYTVQTEQGSSLRRNRRFIKAAPTAPTTPTTSPTPQKQEPETSPTPTANTRSGRQIRPPEKLNL